MPGTPGVKQWDAIQRSPRGWRLLRFLKRKPLPAKLVGETLDGDEVTCAVNKTGPAQWTDTISVLKDCVKVSALDKEGSVLRVLELDPNDPELQAEAEAEAAARARVRSAGGVQGAVPIISVDIPKLVDNIAKNMQQVASEASRQNAAAFKEGFAAMVSVVNVCLNLLVRVEQRLAEAEDSKPESPPEVGGRDQLALMAIQKALGGGGGSETNGHNGNGAGFDPAKIAQVLSQLATATEDEDAGS